MDGNTYNPPRAKSDWPAGLALGIATAVFLFMAMALAQIIGGYEKPEQESDETQLAYQPPEIEEIEEEEPPPPEEEEPEPELEQEPPQISLDQLDVALNPGTGNLTPSDFSMPSVSTASFAKETEDFVDFSDLDQKPSVTAAPTINFPSSVKRQHKGFDETVRMLVRINEKGDVVDVECLSDVPEAIALNLVDDFKTARFSPPTQNGRAVKAKIILPIRIKL